MDELKELLLTLEVAYVQVFIMLKFTLNGSKVRIKKTHSDSRLHDQIFTITNVSFGNGGFSVSILNHPDGILSNNNSITINNLEFL